MVANNTTSHRAVRLYRELQVIFFLARRGEESRDRDVELSMRRQPFPLASSLHRRELVYGEILAHCAASSEASETRCDNAEGVS